MLSAVTVVILLGEGNVHDVDGLDALTVVPPVGDSPLAARVCAEITRLAPEPPLVIVAVGEQAALLPSVALAQRAARRRVTAYVLVDPLYPEVSDGWPDARVHVLGSPGFELRTAELRGWETGPVTELGTLMGTMVADR
jgi:hypothetical protein